MDLVYELRLRVDIHFLLIAELRPDRVETYLLLVSVDTDHIQLHDAGSDVENFKESCCAVGLFNFLKTHQVGHFVIEVEEAVFLVTIIQVAHV